MPGRSAMKVGWAAVGSDSAAVLPSGRTVKDQRNVSESWLASDEPRPSSVTVASVAPTTTAWSGPPSATGLLFRVLRIAESGRLSVWPSLTMSSTT